MTTIGKLLFEQPIVIVACDVTDFDELQKLVSLTYDIPGIGGYKLGFALGYRGLSEATEIIKEYTEDALIIFDHQKGGTDIPAMGKVFAQIMDDSEIDAAILFPFGGRVTEEKWIEALQEAGIIPVVGGEMTHEGFLRKDGGFIADAAPWDIYEIAVNMGVSNFVVPGNKVESVAGYKDYLDRIIGTGKYTLSAPGFITQGGKVSEFAKVAGDKWAAIVGSGIYAAPDIREAAFRVVSALGY